MKIVEVKTSNAAPAEKVWSVLADFGGFLNWAGGGQGEIRIEGDGIGMIRHLKMGVGEIGEKLTVLDQGERQLGYEIVYGDPIGMKTYSALVTVSPVSDGTSELSWRGQFEPVMPGSEDQVAEALEAAFVAMNQALESHVQGLN
ncbi:MAG: SRPBCC family protein [Gammaproteobacteria bacterium]|jgi:hypothetical protein|nr:SRPBCC family protein [Gammaproteobacteria bacterium]MBT4493264.1 SRPBCC family protein [Gammaproteobacteria bacterium]MBT7370630.1 SRPBCC family protein [Gammaproteobacteria bacterium]